MSQSAIMQKPKEHCVLGETWKQELNLIFLCDFCCWPNSAMLRGGVIEEKQTNKACIRF